MGKDAAVNPVVESDWAHPFSQVDAAQWKKTYGQYNIHLVSIGTDKYVVRGLGRKEFKRIANMEYKNEDEMENEFVTATLLYPKMTLTELRTKPGALVPQLFEAVMQKSNVEANKEYKPLELPQNLDGIPEKVREEMKEVTQTDINQWFGHFGKIYYEYTEHKTFIYHGLRRSDFEKFRDAQRKNEHFGPTSEEALVSQGTIYPFKLDPASDDVLHGTITSLSNLIYAASGFNTASVVETL